MRSTLLSLVTATALVFSTASADARPTAFRPGFTHPMMMMAPMTPMKRTNPNLNVSPHMQPNFSLMVNPNSNTTPFQRQFVVPFNSPNTLRADRTTFQNQVIMGRPFLQNQALADRATLQNGAIVGRPFLLNQTLMDRTTLQNRMIVPFGGFGMMFGGAPLMMPTGFRMSFGFGMMFGGAPLMMPTGFNG